MSQPCRAGRNTIFPPKISMLENNYYLNDEISPFSSRNETNGEDFCCLQTKLSRLTWRNLSSSLPSGISLTAASCPVSRCLANQTTENDPIPICWPNSQSPTSRGPAAARRCVMAIVVRSNRTNDIERIGKHGESHTLLSRILGAAILASLTSVRLRAASFLHLLSYRSQTKKKTTKGRRPSRRPRLLQSFFERQLCRATATKKPPLCAGSSNQQWKSSGRS